MLKTTCLKETGLSLFQRAILRIKYGKVKYVSNHDRNLIHFIKQGTKEKPQCITVIDPETREIVRQTRTIKTYDSKTKQVHRVKLTKDSVGNEHLYDGTYGDAYNIFSPLNGEKKHYMAPIEVEHTYFKNNALGHKFSITKYDYKDVPQYTKTNYSNKSCEHMTSQEKYIYGKGTETVSFTA